MSFKRGSTVCTLKNNRVTATDKDDQDVKSILKTVTYLVELEKCCTLIYRFVIVMAVVIIR